MIELNRATINLSDLDAMHDEIRQRWMAKDIEIRRLYDCATSEELEEVLKGQVEHAKLDTVYLATHTHEGEKVNYQISVRAVGEGGVHLSIKRVDRLPARDWRALQEIKNAIVGEECEGVELFPAESRLVDMANQTHLWCFDDPTFRMPVGWDSGRMASDIEVGKSKQRKLDTETEKGDGEGAGVDSV